MYLTHINVKPWGCAPCPANSQFLAVMVAGIFSDLSLPKPTLIMVPIKFRTILYRNRFPSKTRRILVATSFWCWTSIFSLDLSEYNRIADSIHMLFCSAFSDFWGIKDEKSFAVGGAIKKSIASYILTKFKGFQICHTLRRENTGRSPPATIVYS